MKKGILVLAFGVIALASCKKEYTCECVDSALNETVETHKGKDATDACNDAGTLIPLKVCVPQ